MKITQLRNATVIPQIGSKRILVEPVLSRQGLRPPLRFLGD
jgi:L-ascorbate metabolism protein UlaG (beta-lactamase superfamily)